MDGAAEVSAGEGNSAGEGPAAIRVACSGFRVEASRLLFASGLIPVVDFEVFWILKRTSFSMS